MSNNMNRIDLVKQNIKQFFAEIRARKELKRKYRLDKLVRNIPVENNSGYKDFTPESEIENGEEYIRALHWALKNKEVKNIALAGPYGSGKSSIIRSYLKKHPSTCALDISLATFDWGKKEYDEFKSEVELGILKQLFYKVSSVKLPQSRYRKIHKRYYKRFVVGVTILFALGLMVFGFFFPEHFIECINRIVECGSYYGLSEKGSYIITGMFGILGILSISYICKWMVTHFKIKEVNIVDKATISDEKEENSIFDRNMDEIVYFFEETSYDTIFIEDLDRFESSEIFVKLRELNTILNSYDLIKRRIVFVYAVKDDMFRDEERTKFFDFIIPVIPIINSTNSGEKLRDKLNVVIQEDGTYRSSLYDISSSFITLVSPFIEDMRVLTSICNEFVVYKKTLQGLRLKDEELFSIIIYKNLFPMDFSELEAERGIVKKAFSDKRVFVDNKIDQLKKRNTEQLAILDGIEEDILIDLYEVKAAFINFLTENKGSFYYCIINGNEYYYTDIMAPEFDMELFNCDNKATVYYYNENGNRRDILIDNLKTKIESSGRSYIQRFHSLKYSEYDRKEAIRKEIEDRELSIMNVRTFSLKRLLEKYGAEDVLSEEVRENKILVFLLRKGFINENYADYINYFHPKSITSDEMNYIRGIRMEEAVGDFSYRIKNVSQVCDRIEDYEFKQMEALNYDVVDYLITNRNSDEKCIKLFEGLALGTNKSIEFIKTYVERNQNIPIFIKTLCKYYSAFWLDICNNESFSEDSKFKYLSLICIHASIEDISDMNRVNFDNSIKRFIIERKHALAKLSNVKPEKMIDIIKHLYIYFVCIDIKGVDHAVLEYIYMKNQYDLNIDMITSFFEYRYPDKLTNLKEANYTTICETKDVSLMSYIHNNFDRYVTKIVLDQDTNTCENIHAVEDILERLYKTKPDICKQVLGKENVMWIDLDDCCSCGNNEEDKDAKQVIWDYLLNNKMIYVSWSNLMCYYRRYKLTSTLLSWINKEIEQLIKDDQVQDVTDEAVKDIIVEDISLETFEEIIKRFRVKEFTNSLNEFTPEKTDILVKEKYIPFSINMLNEMKEVAQESVKEYIVYNKEKFFDNIEDVTLEIHIIAQLLSANEIENNDKMKLFDLFDEEDIDKELALNIRELQFKAPKTYVESAWEILDEGDRYQLLLNQLDVYTLDEISNKLLALAPVYQKLADRTRRHTEYLDVDDWGYNKQLLDQLKDKGYLTSVDVESYYVDNIDTHEGEQRQRFIVRVKKSSS